jgi:hypothetical protein
MLAAIALFGAADPFIGERGDELPAMTLGSHLEFTLLVLNGLLVVEICRYEPGVQKPSQIQWSTITSSDYVFRTF